MLSTAEKAEIEEELAILPERPAACIEALKAVQRHRGWVSDEAVADVAEFLGISSTEVDSVATFYNLIYRKPVGRHVVLVCESVSCWILGCDRIRKSLTRTLDIDYGQTTADGRFTILPMQCLGVCEQAPALMIDEDLHADLTEGRLTSILEQYD